VSSLASRREWIRHEQTLRAGTPGLVSTSIRFVGAHDVRVTLNTHSPLAGLDVPAISDLLVCLRPDGGRAVEVVRSWGSREQARSWVGGSRFFVQPPGIETHWSWSDSLRARNVVVPKRVYARFLEEAGEPTDRLDALAVQAFDDRFLLAVSQRLWERSGAAPTPDLEVEHLVQAMLYALLSGAPRARARQKAGGLAPWQLKRVTDLLTDDLAAHHPLAEIAAVIDMSAYHLCRAFKASIGLPPHRWLTARRMEKAAELLTTTNTPITTIALAVGYEGASQLARAFRKHWGTVPSLYRRDNAH